MGLSALDLTVIIVYMAVVVGKSGFLTRYQRNLDEFFHAGRRLGWFPVAMSLVATLLSGITFQGAPGDGFARDIKMFLMLFGVLWATVIVVRVIMPFYFHLRLRTAYEYLERRFDRTTRRFAACMFILWRIAWQSLVVYVPALTVALCLNLGGYEVTWQQAVIVLGASAMLYTMLGGVMAVIWTDMMQFFVLFAGLGFAFLGVTRSVGMGEALSYAYQHGRLALPTFSLDMTERVTVWNALLGGGLAYLAFLTADQLFVQRYVSARSITEARRSLICHAVIVPCCTLFYLLGVLFWVHHQHHPDFAAQFQQATAHLRAPQDAVLPFFAMVHMPVGIKGLVIAGLLAATMSSIDSALNSLSLTVVTDLGSSNTSPDSDKAAVRRAQMWTAIWGVVITGAALLVGSWGQGVIPMIVAFNGFLGGPLLGIFLLGLFTRRTCGTGVVLGAMTGAGATLLVWRMTSVSSLWYIVISTTVCVSVGYAASLLFPAPDGEAVDRFVWQRTRALAVVPADE